jgi:hypothetical protein
MPGGTEAFFPVEVDLRGNHRPVVPVRSTGGQPTRADIDLILPYPGKLTGGTANLGTVQQKGGSVQVHPASAGIVVGRVTGQHKSLTTTDHRSGHRQPASCLVVAGFTAGHRETALTQFHLTLQKQGGVKLVTGTQGAGFDRLAGRISTHSGHHHLTGRILTERIHITTGTEHRQAVLHTGGQVRPGPPVQLCGAGLSSLRG